MTEIVTIPSICNAMAATIRGRIDGLTVQSYNELTEGIETPLLQIYWQGFAEDASQVGVSGSRAADRSASLKSVIVADDTFIWDLYARERSNLDEDIAAVVELVDSIRNIFYEQKQSYFGLTAIKAVHWQCQRQTLTANDPELKYAGARFTVITKVY